MDENCNHLLEELEISSSDIRIFSCTKCGYGIEINFPLQLCFIEDKDTLIYHTTFDYKDGNYNLHSKCLKHSEFLLKILENIEFM